jgi:hypothetical protein
MAAAKRRRARSSSVRTLGLLALLGGAVFLLLRPSLVQLRAEHARLRARFSALVDSNPSLRSAPAAGEAALGVPLPYVRDLVETIAPSWLNEAQLNLGGIKLSETGELKKKTLLGEVRLGEWRLDLDVRKVQAVLRAGRPQLSPKPDGRIGVRLPITVVRGRGEATVRFSWDASGVASVVCRDFSLTREVSGEVVPETHAVSGEFVVSSEHGAVLAEPRLSKQPWLVRVRPSASTRKALRAALAEQDSFFKCGIAMDPEEVLRKLERMLAQGITVQLPALVLPALRVPAAFQYSLERGTQPIDLAVTSEDLRVSPQYIWLAASIRAQRRPSVVISTPVAAVTPDGTPGLSDPSLQETPLEAASASTPAGPVARPPGPAPEPGASPETPAVPAVPPTVEPSP